MRRSERILCLVTDRRLAAAPLDAVVAEAVAGGIDWIQLREPDLDGRALCALAERVVAAARRAAAAAGREVRVLINRRVDVSLAVGADGVHLGWNAMPIAAARALLGPDAIVGVAAHAPGEVHSAIAAGADYATLAPIFAPLSKPAGRPPLGLVALEKCGGTCVLAQGGIDVANAAAAIRAGAAGIAVTGALLAATDPRAAAAALRAALDGVAG